MTSYDNVTVTTPTGTTHPLLWMELGTTRTASTVVHETLAGGTVVVHGTPPRSRQTTLIFLYDLEAESKAAEDMLAAGGVCQIAAPDRPTHQMTFAVTGEISRNLDPDSASVWIVTAEVQEILA